MRCFVESERIHCNLLDSRDVFHGRDCTKREALFMLINQGVFVFLLAWRLLLADAAASASVVVVVVVVVVVAVVVVIHIRCYL